MNGSSGTGDLVDSHGLHMYMHALYEVPTMLLTAC